MEVKNRCVMPPMVTNFGTESGGVTDRHLRYYDQRSKSGVGLIIVEGSIVAWEHRILDNNIGIYDDHCIPGLAQLVKRIIAHGARTFIQLLHAGNMSLVAKRVGPSPIKVWDGPLPEELTGDEIEMVKEWFVEATRRAQVAVFLQYRSAPQT